MVIVVTDCVGNMKGSRLADVLDDTVLDTKFWNGIFAKMNQLLIKIEATNPSIDDQELRWVQDRCEYYEAEERILTKKEMQIANLYWNKYKNSKFINKG